jgi:hypothetical protein
MPFADIRDVQPRGIAVRIAPSPVPTVPGGPADTEWAMSYHTAHRPQELFRTSGLGGEEMRALKKLPRPLVAYLLEEAEDPAFVTDYLIPALNTPNPYKRIVNDIAAEVYEYDEDLKHGVGGLGKKKKGFFKKIKKVHKKTAQRHRKIRNKVRPKFMKKIHKKVSKGAKKVWRQYGAIIISVVGAVLAPFTGGASLAAAAVLSAAHTMYYKKQAAVAARKAAKVETNQLKAEADKSEAETAATVDKFYKDNEAWFLQYDITPEKWAKLKLDEKIKLIEAGVKGELPKGTTEVPMPQQGVVAQTQATMHAAQAAGIPAAAVAPPGAPPGTGYDPSTGGAPTPREVAQGAAQEGTAKQYVAVVEGQSIGTFGSVEEAYQAILDSTQPGARFEILVDGQTMGLAIRTAEGSVEAPPEAEEKIREMPPEQVREVVAQADAQPAKGGFPWWLLIAGGAAAFAAKG